MSNFAKKAWGGGGSSDAYAHNITCMYTVSMCRLQKITIIFIAPQQIFLPNENDYIVYKFLKILEISHKLNMI